jgi:predicted DNA-binding helix-hairpin-helix protein
MARIAVHINDAKEERKASAKRVGQVVSMAGIRPARATPPRFAPGGQSTQMIVGADASDDRSILGASANLYGSYRLKRVYYSAFSPIPDASSALPLRAPPLMREHRLYQADWLMRFYGFEANEIVPPGQDMLSLEVDPKLAWALAHADRFPVDLNCAPRELMLRVPGLGVRTVDRFLAARRVRRLRSDDLRRLKLNIEKVLPFVVLADYRPPKTPALQTWAMRLKRVPVQGELFAA